MPVGNNASVGVFGAGGTVDAAAIVAAVADPGDAADVASALRAKESVAGSSFTASAGLGTATAATLTLTTAAQCTAWTDLPRCVYDHGGDPFNVEVEATLAALSGGTADSFLPLSIRNGSGNALLLAQLKGSDRTITVYDASTLVASGSAISVGTGRLKLVVRDGAGAVYSSNDGGATWTLLKGGIALAGGPGYTHVAFSIYQAAGPGGTVSVRWSDVTIRRPL